MQTDIHPLLTVEEVAAILRRPVLVIRRDGYAGRIPGAVRLGARTLRFDAEAIRAWLAEHRVGGDS